MEKKYLELSYNGVLVGAFEDVKKLEKDERGTLTIESADGNYTIPRVVYGGKEVYYIKELALPFDNYKLVCRRTLRGHTNNLDDKVVKQVKIGG